MAFREIRKFLGVSLLAMLLYVAYGYRVGHSAEALSVATFVLGVLAVALVALRFGDDYAGEHAE